MINIELQEVAPDILPELPQTHVSLLKQRSNNAAINTLERFVLKN